MDQYQHLCRIAGKTWGINKNIKRLLYKTVIERTRCHGAAAWGHNMTSRLQKKLDSVQRLILLYITGAYRTSPTAALQVVTGLQPLHLQIQQEATYARVARARSSSNFFTVVFSPTDYERKSSGIHIHPHNFLLHNQISFTENHRDSGAKVIYTNGSKTDEGTGSAYCILENYGIIASCYIISISSTGPLVGFSVKLFGLRAVTISGCLFSAIAIGGCFFAEDIVTIIILWGVAYGISFGCGTLSIPHYLSLRFSEHLDKANGIALAGDSVGYFLLSLTTQYSLATYGLSGTFLIISGIMLHSVPAALLMKFPKETLHQTEHDSSTEKCRHQELPSVLKEVNSSSGTNCNAIKTEQQTSAINAFRVFLDPVYVLIVITQSVLVYIYSTTFTILIDVSRDHGVSVDHEVHLFLAIFVAELFGRLCLGSITDAGYLTKLDFTALGFAALGLLYLAVIWVRGSAVMMVFGFFFGLVAGGISVVSGTLVTFYTDKEYHNIAIPSRYILYPPVSFTQAPLVGYFRDTLQSYDGLLYILITKIMGLEVDSNHIDELVERHRQELTTEELVELHFVSQIDFVEESVLEKEEVKAKPQSVGALRQMLKAWETVASYIIH
ncbi:hypothetical protein AVEN_227548-1 [Araneus ventricosus]|uniref:Uncharacterized protein n=1 Tax=Araneus ventricosus TaxID=182803 RepID=A0A4Y2C6U3_ARAVE|nr:hypothetical protein AVEN_227548-1 [Araneus ventricosus]